jgi:hypothetical protein
VYSDTKVATFKKSRNLLSTGVVLGILGMRLLLLTPLLNWTLFAQGGAAPDANQQREILAHISQVALRYKGHLPDFSCTEVIDRSRADSGQIGSGSAPQWKHQDTLEVAAGYLDDQAVYKLLKVNGKPPGFHPFENGLGSQGVLGAALVPNHIFDPRVRARFNWLKEEIRQGKLLYVFTYEVAPFLKLKDGSKEVTVGFHGYFSADPETGMILSRHQEMDSPPDYRYPQYITDIEYGPVTISGVEMVLPVKASENVREGKHLMRNEIQFVNYRKYSADSTVTFGEPK